MGIRTGSISTNESVPRIEIWVRNLVENFQGIIEAGEGGESGGSEESTGGEGVEEEADAEHLGMDLVQLFGFGALINE